MMYEDADGTWEVFPDGSMALKIPSAEFEQKRATIDNTPPKKRETVEEAVNRILKEKGLI